ncbi:MULTISPECIES: BglG family transcription antiterminator LicT [unclassified Streptococcus]|uniref:BglG family transcription antiterminator LicT n=1 Tax=unclassified Streptococcus TaxID=2608887 RepID=UPI0010725E22|nr:MULTISPECIES: PRD domain-containing protein [unclassified Streptococcus]MBF0786437.1 PRD domain-containing protein [Streptococcus sp. 19428wC2_LYSM12]MCQ9212545.1 PRD domain-containing protein [Streptococcus sp. B01]MCQ9213884.1 PRD domain-containing protein [Streptococcus sp. O1]TFV06845.1 PRD domain-containing protein [Streptococcus sp. LYSM12]
MIIKRILNHNAVIATNKKEVDILLFGKGIAFAKKIGDEVPAKAIEKSFLLKNRDNMTRFTELFINVPLELVYICEKIINLGKITLGNHFDEIIYINLTDHIQSTIERHKEGIVITNPLRWEIEKYYPEEYKIGKQALDIIKKATKIVLEEDEAAFIALHFVNANLENNFQESYKITEIIIAIEQIVKNFYVTEFNQESVEYYRFITHIKLFAHRLLAHDYYQEDDDDDLLALMSKKYPKEYECGEQVALYIQEKYSYQLSSSELLYLTAHIRRLTKKLY